MGVLIYLFVILKHKNQLMYKLELTTIHFSIVARVFNNFQIYILLTIDNKT